jgi:hypothetical protein
VEIVARFDHSQRSDGSLRFLFIETYFDALRIDDGSAPR